jgi:hypothetical protein
MVKLRDREMLINMMTSELAGEKKKKNFGPFGELEKKNFFK